jgi:hypothetical protein
MAIDSCRCGALRPVSALPGASGSRWAIPIPPEYRRLAWGLALGILVFALALYRSLTQPPPPPIVPVLGYSVDAERAGTKSPAPSAKPR